MFFVVVGVGFFMFGVGGAYCLFPVFEGIGFCCFLLVFCSCSCFCLFVFVLMGFLGGSCFVGFSGFLCECCCFCFIWGWVVCFSVCFFFAFFF